MPDKCGGAGSRKSKLSQASDIHALQSNGSGLELVVLFLTSFYAVVREPQLVGGSFCNPPILANAHLGFLVRLWACGGRVCSAGMGALQP